MKHLLINIFILLLTVGANSSFALSEKWNAKWITHPAAEKGNYDVLHFRNTFFVDHTSSLVIRISADIRYKLYLNGDYLGQGPANNDLKHYSFDTYELKDKLKEGRNVLAVVVWSFGSMNPLRYETGGAKLIVQSENKAFEKLNTGSGSWKVEKDASYSPTFRGRDFEVISYYAMGGGEQIDGSTFPWNWQALGFDDSDWAGPDVKNNGEPYGYAFGYGEAEIGLSPRGIPMMDESQESRPGFIRCGDDLQGGMKSYRSEVVDSWENEKSIVIPANTEVSFLFDQGYLTKGFPSFVFSDGKKARIEVSYAENLFTSDMKKGNRNETEGKTLIGITDRYLADGGKSREYSPLLSRTWRYFRVDVATDAEPLVWEKYSATKFLYPFEENAVFSTDDSIHNKIWKTGWRTARLCADETYMDCPYYEELQYIGDTRIQALLSLSISGDNRLMKNAIRQFGNSITNEGITQSRFPSHLLQYIPPYSLFMINMLHDHHLYSNDDEFTKEYLYKIAGILFWFEKHLRRDNLLGPMPWWSYVDTTDDFKMSSPPGSWDGGSTVLTLQYIYALQDAIELFDYFGKKELSSHFKEVLQKSQEAVRNLAYDNEKNMFADTPFKQHFSQHANILAILTNTAPQQDQPNLFRKIADNDEISHVNIYFSFYLLEAARKSGNGNYFLNHLDLWKDMLDEGLTTFAEHKENTRSDCHAWSASPNYFFLNTVCGIMPVKPHFSEVIIAPNLGDLKEVTGKMPHPNGSIKVHYVLENQKLKVEVSLPKDVTGKFKWKNRQVTLKQGVSKIEL